MATTSMSDPREQLQRSIEGIEQMLAGETNPEKRRIWEDALFEKQMQAERLQGKPWSAISGLRYGPPTGSRIIPSTSGYGTAYDAIPNVGSIWPGDTGGVYSGLKVDVQPGGAVKVTNTGPANMFTDNFISSVESGETPIGEAKAEIAHSKREKAVSSVMSAEDEISRRYGTPTPRDEYMAATKAFQAEKAAIPEKAPTKANLGDINVDDPYDPTGKRAKAGISGVDFSGKFSRSLGPAIGLGLGAALAPEDVWANPLSQPGLQYGLESATGINPAGLATDPRAYAPFAYGAAGDIVSGVGQGVAAGLDTSQVGIDLEQDFGMGGGIDRFGRTRAGPDTPAGYDLSAQMPGLAGTQTGMPVAVDAGGAVGGYPTMDADYGTMATEESDYVPDDPTGGLIDIDALAGRFSVGPMSMASTDLYSEAGVPMSNENLSFFGAAPVSTSPSMNVDYSEALKSTNDLSSEIQQRYQDYRDSYGEPTDSTNPIPTMPDWSWGEIVGPLAGIDPTHFDRMRMVDKLSSTGTLDVPSKHTMDTYAAALKSSDLVSSGGSKALATALGLPGIVTASIPQTVGHYAGLYGETMPNLGQVIDDSIEKNVLGITTPDVTPGVFSSAASDWSPIASPTITAQDTIAAYNAASMGEIASHPGQGGYIGDTERTIGEHLAAVNERVQAMPAAVTPAPAAPAQPAGPSAADIERQKQAAINARLAQQATARQQAQQAAAARAQAASAAQAQAAQANARALLASAASRDRGGPSSREIAAAREVMSGVDSFGSGNPFQERQQEAADRASVAMDRSDRSSGPR